MRLGGDNGFDLTDVDEIPIDNLDAILDVAAEVLGEYGNDPSNTRIERLARWVAFRVGDVTEGGVEVLKDTYGIIVRAGGNYDDDRVWVTGLRSLTAEYARVLACALLRAADKADAFAHEGF